jgi:Leucine-rich repeat (LRR) protein
MPSITHLGWRSGSLTTLNADALPPNIIHLILTDNQLQSLDDENVWARLINVRKLMLSHNQIQHLSPTGVQYMKNLELLRLAGNQLTSIPDGTFFLSLSQS